MDSRDFDPKLFTRPSEYEEDALRDRKVEIHSEAAKAELIRDVIAMANTACLWGKPAYILYGIRDSTNESPGDDVVGLKLKDEQRVWEGCRNRFANLFKELIRPAIAHWSFEHGQVNAKVVAYLCFEPHNPSRPYAVSKPFKVKGQDSGLEKEQTWIRDGESKRLMTPDEYKTLRFRVPWVLPRQWEAFFDGQLAKLSRYQQIDGYQQLRLTSGELLSERLHRFAKDPRCSVLVVQGPAGIGKTVALGRFACQLAEDGLVAVRRIRMSREFKPPPSLIPVYFRLRLYKGESVSRFVKRLMNVANVDSSLWTKGPQKPEFLLERKDLSWVICLDGFDEIWSESHREKFRACLADFLAQYRHVKVIITTRPPLADLFDSLREVAHVEKVDVESLGEDEVVAYLKSLASPDRVDDALKFLKSDPDLWRLCRVPAYLEQAVKEAVGSFLPLPRLESAEPWNNLTSDQQSDTHAEQVDLREPATVNKNNPDFNLESVRLLDGLTAPDHAPAELFSRSSIDSSHQESADAIYQSEDEQALLPRLGVLVRDVYEGLWQRESQRQAFRPEKLQRWREAVNRLALKAPVYPSLFPLKDAFSLLRSEMAVGWVCSMGVWEHADQRGYRYATLLTQASFATSYLEGLIRNKQAGQCLPLINSLGSALRERVEQLLKDCVDEEFPSLSGA